MKKRPILFSILLLIAVFYVSREFGVLKLFIEKHGEVHVISEEHQSFGVDISSWAETVREKRGMDEEMAAAWVEVTEELKFTYESGHSASFEDIYIGQEVQLIENEAGEVTEIVLLTLDKYGTVADINKGSTGFQVDLSDWEKEVQEVGGKAGEEGILSVEHANNLAYSTPNGGLASISDVSVGKRVRLLENDMNRIVEVVILEEE